VTAEARAESSSAPRRDAPEPAPAPEAPRDQPARTEEVRAAADRLAEYLRSIGRHLRFHVDEASGTVVVSVMDDATGERIRQIPSEEMLRLARRRPDDSGSFLVNLKV
jgi:flagellar protein FlaG